MWGVVSPMSGDAVPNEAGTLPERLVRLGLAPDRLGVILVDHGSRRRESNALLLQIVEFFKRETGLPLVEPAHMELAEPTVAQAYARCVAAGARSIVVYPYFLLPGRHWHTDIPRLAQAAAEAYPATRYLVAAPLGLHVGLVRAVEDRITTCLSSAMRGPAGCAVCTVEAACQWRGGV